MWYEENNQFVRAPTPQSFDRLVQNLEDNDSVLFQSIRLPSTKSDNDNHHPPNDENKAPIEEDNDVKDLDDEINDLKDKIAEIEFANQRKDEMIRSRDEQIASLQRQIQELQGSPARPMTSISSRPCHDADLMQYYKSQYETTLFRYEKLKEALSLNDSLKKGRTAHSVSINKYTATKK